LSYSEFGEMVLNGDLLLSATLAILGLWN
jgi:hypothetical protein